MKGFKKLIFLGVFLVTFLVVIHTIDAGKKDPKRNGIDNQNGKEKNMNSNEKFSTNKPSKTKKNKAYKNVNNEADLQEFGEESKYETSKYKVKKETKRSKSEKINPLTEKNHQKVKKYKLEEDGVPSKTKSKKTKLQDTKEENIDKLYKSIKKNSQKGFLKKKDNEATDEELNSVNEEHFIYEEESNGGTPKRRKYKLVEVILQEDGEQENEGNETTIDAEYEDQLVGTEKTEQEELIEKFHTTQTVKLPKAKTFRKTCILTEEDSPKDESAYDEYYSYYAEEEISESREDSSSNRDSSSSKYDDPSFQGCMPLPEDPNRIGPKKLVLYVIEEEVEGRVVKKVIPEEDGVTMCEVADLLKGQYFSGLP